MKFLKPNPPSELLCVRLSKLAQHIPLLSGSPFHQKFLVTESNLSHSFLGSKKHDIAYDGIVWTTDLIRISFPPWDNGFNFHPCIFFIAFSTRKVYASDRDLPQKEGSPRYLESVFIGEYPCNHKTVVSLWESYWEENTKPDFSKFINWPEAFP